MRVSAVCPTRNRHRYFEILIDQFNGQTYPQENMELIIFDDSEYKYENEIIQQGNIRYIHDNSKVYKIWEKRQLLNEISTGDYIVCMDDDDIYMNDYVECCISTLHNSNKLLAGIVNPYKYCILNTQMYRGKMKCKNMINCTLSYKREILKYTNYIDNGKNNAEEVNFTKNFTIDAEKLDNNCKMIHMKHTMNTVRKRWQTCSRLKTDTKYIKYLEPIFAINPIIYLLLKKKKSIGYKHVICKQVYGQNKMLFIMNRIRDDKHRKYSIIMNQTRFENLKTITFYERLYYYLLGKIEWTILTENIQVKDTMMVIIKRDDHTNNFLQHNIMNI